MKIVLPKGRLLPQSINSLNRAGLNISMPVGRSLISRQGDTELIISRPSDVPTYVERFADLGIVGRDITEEYESDVFIPLKLDFGKCRLSLAMPYDRVVRPDEMDGYTIATRYPSVTAKFFESLDVNINIVRLSGSIELAPSMGISDAITDIVETGNTLKENGLVETLKVMDIYAQVIVNRVALKNRFEEINGLIGKMEQVILNDQ